eukprot:11459319-Ditylum_brightwellii.AAC.1
MPVELDSFLGEKAPLIPHIVDHGEQCSSQFRDILYEVAKPMAIKEDVYHSISFDLHCHFVISKQ